MAVVGEGASGDSMLPVADAQTAMRRGRLFVLAALILMGAVFAIGAGNWVRFFLDPNEANGVPIRLFTQADFPAVVIASRMVSEGQGARLYNLDAQRNEQRKLIEEGYIYLPPDIELKYPYPYTPFIAVLWSPLSGLSPLAGIAIWNLLQIAALAGGLWYLLLSLPMPLTTRLLLLLAALTCFPFISNLEQGQSSGIVMFSLAMGVALMKRGHDLPAGLALGLLALKVQWLPLLLLALLFKRRWRALGGMALTAGALSLLVLPAIGTEWLPDFVRVLEGAQMWDRRLLLDPWFSHSLSGGLTAFLGQGTDELVAQIMRVATIPAAGLLFLLWKGQWRPGTARWDGAMGATVLATILTNLQVNTHDLCLLALPAALGVSYFYASPKGESVKRGWYALLWAAYLVPSLLLPQTFASPVRFTTLVIGLMLGLLCMILLKRQPSKPVIYLTQPTS